MVWPAIIAGVAGLAGGLLSGDRNRKSANAQMDMQREFAQNGIRWRMEDARAAGVHPLFAMGANVSSPSPIAVQDSYGPALAQAGQDVSRAWDATRTQRERAESDAQAFMLARERESDARVLTAQREHRENLRLDSQLKTDELQRALILSQLARQSQARGPGMPPSVDDERGQVDTGRIKLKPAEQPARDPYSSSKEAGSQPMWQRRETAPGVFRDFPHPDTNLDSEIVHAILAAQGYADKWVSDTFFGGAPKYIQAPRRRYAPSPGAYDMDRGYQRYGVQRKGR